MFKDRLRELRVKKGLTQEELAEKIYVSRSAICKWEMGNGLPSDSNIEGLCSFFNVSEEWLLDREDLKDYISKGKNLRKKTIIISLSGIIIPLLMVFWTFVGIFRYKSYDSNLSHILLYITPKSVFNFIEGLVIIPLFVYVASIIVSFINIIQFVKEEVINKMLIGNIVLIFISIVFYFIFLIIAIIIANNNGFVIFL